MLMRRNVVSISMVGLASLGAGIVSGQDYPSKPIRIVTLVAGGSNDVQARVIAPLISVPLGQPIIIDNRGVSLVAIESVAKAPPDGYTLLYNGASLWVMPLLQKVPYDVVKDFLPVSQITREVYVVAVHPSLPVKSIKDLIALAKAKPGELNFATSSIGGSTHMSGVLFRSLAGVDILNVNYKGTGPAMVALMGGEVHMMFANATIASSQMKSGKVRGLAVTSATPSVLVPGLPTVAETVPGYESIAMTGIFVPSKTPVAVINRLNQEIVRALSLPEVKERFVSGGAEAVSSTPEQFAAAIKLDTVTVSKLIKDAGIKAE
jgi:tripartite-type tricarboxylate transporter receptor subunit TctC